MEKDTGTKKVLNEDSRKILQNTFKGLKRRVRIEVFTKEGSNEPFNNLSINFVRELAEITDKIEGSFLKIGDARAKEKRVEMSPTILIDPDRYDIRYTGAPAGEEGRSFIETLLMVSADESGLSEDSRKRLAKMKERRHVQVFVTAACPYCPGEVINANRAAVERPDLVSSECVESSENVDLARKFNVGSVPQTVINGKTINIGLQPEDLFISGLISLEEQKAPETARPGEDIIGEYDLIIVGAGPAGLTAGIYSSRSGLSNVILEKSIPGGQVAVTPVVENWPGMTNVPGKHLMDLMVQHARSYTHIHENEEVLEVKVGRRIEAITRSGRYLGNALLIATGATHRKLEAPGEDRLYGKGVSYCATCDGYFYKDRKVIVVGGGNTALTDALYLDSLGAKVTIVHRRGEFRAEKRLVESVKERKIEIVWDSEVVEIKGEERVDSVLIRGYKGGKTKKLKTDAVFVGIGETPLSEIAASIGVVTNEAGFIQVDQTQRTNIPRVYAAGDVTSGIRQIVTATGTGAVAALSVFQDISRSRK